MRIHHLALRTRDPERLVAFYEGALGLPRVAHPGAHGVWLRAGDAVVMIERAGESEPGVPDQSLELVAFAVDREALAAAEARLARSGALVEARTASTIYLRDPDGRRVGLSCYPLP
jgi:catechol 2,3-dioxygenase-like lactoylglutathione lyase family enzyme